jgi:glycosyltransferase involved in cell wall biosynthesis
MHVKPHITVAIPTKNRYYDTLPLTLMSVALQTLRPDEVIIGDDSNNPLDIRTIPVYQHILHVFEEKGIKWRVIFGQQRGQHHLHEQIQQLAQEWVWRIDDDEIAEPSCLALLVDEIRKGIGAVGGLVLTAPVSHETPKDFNLIEQVTVAQNCQWVDGWKGVREVEHLYSSFIYKKGIAHFNLALSPVAHREETMFSHEIHRAGYKLLASSAARTWHFRNPSGGIRTQSDASLWENDEKIFRLKMKEWGVNSASSKLVVLDSGIGDHIVFKKYLPELKKRYDEVVIACCYPFVFEGEKTMSIADAKQLTPIDHYNVYRFMIEKNWKEDMLSAYKAMYENHTC